MDNVNSLCVFFASKDPFKSWSVDQFKKICIERLIKISKSYCLFWFEVFQSSGINSYNSIIAYYSLLSISEFSKRLQIIHPHARVSHRNTNSRSMEYGAYYALRRVAEKYLIKGRTMKPNLNHCQIPSQPIALLFLSNILSLHHL